MMDDFYLFVGLAALICIAFYCIYKFAKQPTKTQIENIKEWLVELCIEAEQALGSGTGVLKLRRVYSKVITVYPEIGIFVTFNTFSSWVDVALETAQHIMNTNDNVKSMVTKSENTTEQNCQ